jgi:ubiquinone/menaquinone biosynthesis C-methylase UbiE
LSPEGYFVSLGIPGEHAVAAKMLVSMFNWQETRVTLSILITAIGALCIAVVVAMAVHALAVHAASRWLRVRRKSYGKLRIQLYERLYGLQWGDLTTNNYGFAPAEGEGQERFQLQMYKELYKLLCARSRPQSHTKLLEVSCGRGGGLSHLLKAWPGSSSAVGLDYSANAVRFCRQAYGHIANLAFVQGSGLELPFADASFDVVLNVEASHNYGDDLAFFREVNRVLRPGGMFLYSDYRRPELVAPLKQTLREAALDGEFNDITKHVAEACRLDSDRRRQLIRACVPWYYRIVFGKELANYAAIEGSRKFEAFCSFQRHYYMTFAIKADHSRDNRPAVAVVAAPQDAKA